MDNNMQIELGHICIRCGCKALQLITEYEHGNIRSSVVCNKCKSRTIIQNF